MCRRDEAAADPLLRLVLEQIHLNLLAVPREHAAVGDLYVYDGERTSAPGYISNLLARPFTMPPVVEDEAMADIAGTFSRAVDAKLGVNLLEGFLIALGAPALLTKAKASLDAKGVNRVRFRIGSATRDSVDPLLLGRTLIDNTLLGDHPLLANGSTFYLTSAVARSSAISIVAEDEKGGGVQLEVDALKVAGAETGVSVTYDRENEVSFSGGKRLAFGVELYELSVDPGRGRLRMRLPQGAIRLRDAESLAPRVQPAYIGGDAGDVFVRVSSEGASHVPS